MVIARIFLGFLLLPPAAMAAPGDVYFVEWTPPHFERPFLIPAREGESPKQAVARYRRTVLMNPELSYLHAAVKKWKIEGSFSRLDSGHLPIGAVVANNPKDLIKPAARIERVATPFEKRGIHMAVIPPNAEAGLSSLEALRYRRLAAEKIDLLHAVGGADINPALYNRPTTDARKVNPARDASEYKLVREYYRKGRILFGICRGEQMIGVISGCPLIQDIQKELGAPRHNLDKNHRVYPIDTKAYERLTGTAKPKAFRSRHHQSVDPNPKSFMRPIAHGQHNVIEMIEHVDGRAVGVQFHPEDMPAEDTKHLYDELAARVKYLKRSSCAVSFKALAQSR